MLSLTRQVQAVNEHDNQKSTIILMVPPSSSETVIEVTVLEKRGRRDLVRLAIDSPRHVSIWRAELLDGATEPPPQTGTPATE